MLFIFVTLCGVVLQEKTKQKKLGFQLENKAKHSEEQLLYSRFESIHTVDTLYNMLIHR